MPIVFILIAVRLILKSSPRIKIRLVIVAVVILIAILGNVEAIQGSNFVWFGLLLIIISVAFGAPIFVGLGGAALLLFWSDFVPIASIPAESYRIVVSPTLPTIPLFTLAGYILAESNAAKRLVKVFRAWFGWLPGGTPVVTVAVCAFFTTFTGGSGVTILALGGLLLPMLIQEKYPEKFSIGLLTASGSLGLFFPPSLAVILYGVISHTPIDEIFIAGIVPGIFLMILVALWGIRQGYLSKIERTEFNLKDAFAALWEAKWEVALPVVVLVGIYGGFTTMVETAALAALYALVVEVFIHKDLSLRYDLPRVVSSCATLIGGVLIILSVAMGLTAYLVDAEVPMLALEFVQTHVESPWVFLLTLNILLLLVGAMMDIFSAIVVIVPLIVPIAAAYGIAPVHLAIIFLANLELGYLTPPVGMNLFLASYRFDKDLLTVYRAAIPYLIILLIGVIAITYIPILTLGLGRVLGY
ncbi:MAG: TRAP transporter large permease subunit [Candidatus Marinimicrobia bacterium]|nr:TRAP transporter large permease subunit [Candidatus Neomarinimicrobiota bacterium]